MKINPILNPNVTRAYQSTRPVSESKQVAAGRDEVVFSAEALSFSKSLSAAREAMEARSPEELAHIAGIKEQINAGEYHVDSEDVADRILSSILGSP